MAWSWMVLVTTFLVGYKDPCGYFLWDFLKDTVYTTKELQQVMCAVLTKVSEEL